MILLNLTNFLYSVSYAMDCVEKELLGATNNHSKRVAYFSILIANQLQLPKEQIFDLSACAILHDNALTEYILTEYCHGNNVTTQEERINFKNHCIIGEKNASSFPFLGDVSNVILYHHENVDGSGFFQKKGDEVPIGAQIIRLIDNIDVIFDLSQISYQKQKELTRHLKYFSGKLYNKELVEIFLSLSKHDSNFFSQATHNQIDFTLEKITPLFEYELHKEKLIELGTIFAKIIDYKSQFTKKHSLQIAEKSQIMAHYYQYDDETTTQLYLAASLHDVGKLTINNQILEKPAALTEEEFKIMKQHADQTYQILKKIRGFETITVWASNHHEKLDGSGYPLGRKAEELDFNSQLLACIDIYQALSEDRPYRKGFCHRKSIEIMKEMAENHFISTEIVNDMDKVFSVLFS